MLQCFICGEEVSEEDNEGDEENGLCVDCVSVLEQVNLDLDEEFEGD